MTNNYDITLDGQGYMLVAGGGTSTAYRYEVETAAPAPVRTGIASFAAPAGDTDATRWYARGLLPEPPSLGAAGGLTLAPALVAASASIGTPTAANTRGIVYRDTVYLAVGARLYAVATTTSGGRREYAGVSLVDTVAGAITGMAVVNDLLVLACAAPATTLVAYNGSAFAGDPAVPGGLVWGYANALWLARRDVPARIGATADGGGNWTYWTLDAAVRAVLPTGGESLVATAGTIWRVAGRFMDTVIGGNSVAVWNGTVAPLVALSGGGASDDLAWLVSHRGQVYTWAGGTVQRLAGGGAGAHLEPVPGAPSGAALGACVAGDHLLVCWSGGGPLGAGSGAAAWNGSRWSVVQWSASATPCNPVGTGGLLADGHALLFLAGSAALGRLEFPVGGPTHAPAASGYAVCGPWDAGAGGRVKRWGAITAAWSLVPGAGANPGGTVALETSTDDGATWTSASSATVAANATAGTARFALTGVAGARLAVRLTWTPTSTYAGWRLTGIWADGTAVPAAPTAETWTVRVRCGDRAVRRDGSTDSRTGAEIRAALAALAAAGDAVTFRDRDDDLHPAPRTVRVIGLQETTRRGDGAHFWESEIALTLVSSQQPAARKIRGTSNISRFFAGCWLLAAGC